MAYIDYLETAVAKINSLGKVTARLGTPEWLKQLHDQRPEMDRDEPDVWIEIATPGGTRWYVVEAKSRLSTSSAAAALSQLDGKFARAMNLFLMSGEKVKPRPRALLVAEYINPKVALYLLSRTAEFLDAAGNAFLYTGDYLVHVQGRRIATGSRYQGGLTPKTLAVLQGLLTEPRLRKATFRDLASATGVSVGAANNAIKTLLNDGTLVKTRGDHLALTDFDQARSRWENGYGDRFRATLSPSRWRQASGTLEDLTNLVAEHDGIALGGERAAQALGAPLRPSGATLFVPSTDRSKAVVQLRLVPDEKDGLINVLDSFSRYCKVIGGVPTAHPAIVRAELLALGDERMATAAAWLLEHRVELQGNA